MNEFRERIRFSAAGGGGGGDPERGGFQPTFLLETEDELGEIKHTGLRRLIKKNHLAAKLNTVLENKEYWESEVEGMKKRLKEPQDGEKRYKKKETKRFIKRIKKHIKTLEEPEDSVEVSEGVKPLKEDIRSFSEVDAEIQILIENPDSVRENVVKNEMKELGRYAKEIGMFTGVKRKIEIHQEKNKFIEAASKIGSMDLSSDISEAKGLVGWDPKLEGMIQAYRFAALYNMMDAWKGVGGEKPNGFDQDSWDQLDRLVKMMNYEDPPYLMLSNMAVATLELGIVGGRVRMPERQVAQELPTYFGAVFINGKREFQAEQHEQILKLDVTDKEQRRRFILENLYAFNDLYKNPKQWKGAVDDWLQDFQIAADAHNLDFDVKNEFIEEMRTMAGLNAQARAMELSGGSFKTYLEVLTGVPDGDQGKQDEWSSYLVHADPQKMIDMLKDPLVEGYYQQLMRDAKLVYHPSNEWRKDPRASDKYLPSKVKFHAGISPTDLARGNKIVEYAKNYGGKRGMNGYIEQELLGMGIGQDMVMHQRKAAARLACDLFLIDKWTRWEYAVTDSGKDSDLNLQPKKDWGGDPLRTVIQPSFLPRIKGVYSEDSPILAMMDKTFNPEHILTGELEKLRITPSLVTNAKTINRLDNAIWSFLENDPMGEGIASWNKMTMEKELPTQFKMLYQLWGNKQIRGQAVGEHIMGEQVALILESKSLAFAAQSAKPGFSDMMGSLTEGKDERSAVEGIRQYIWGPDKKGNSGLLAELSSSRMRVKLWDDNRFNAAHNLAETKIILDTLDQTRGRYDDRSKYIAAKLVALTIEFLKNAPNLK